MNEFTENRVIDKVVLIDYLTVSFYDFNIVKWGPNEYRIKDDRYEELLKILGYREEFSNMQNTIPLKGFTNGVLINEHTYISYGGEHVKSHSNYTLSVEMSGQACREFEKYSGHSWVDYFEYIYAHGSCKVTRMDFALDDFAGNEIQLPYIKDLVEQGMYSSLSRKFDIHVSGERKGEEVHSTGYTIYIGTKGNNQLAIYDKKLERMNKGFAVGYDVWNRYELRLVGEKATETLNQYYLALKSNQDDYGYDLKKFVQGLMYQFLDLKDPQDRNTRVRRKATDPKWEKFLDSIAKIDIKLDKKELPSYEIKKEWLQKDMASSIAELILAEDFLGFQKTIYEMVLNSIGSLSPKKIQRLNDYLITNNQPRITEKRINEVVDIVRTMLIVEVDTE
jgi:hypothetical protein